MHSLLDSRAYQSFAPLVARILFGALFLGGAAFKIPGTAGFHAEVGMTAMAGLPFATIFVFLAFLLEVGCGISLILGWHSRLAAILLAVFTLALAVIFYTNFSDPAIMGEFISHMGLIAGLLYISTFGPGRIALSRS